MGLSILNAPELYSAAAILQDRTLSYIMVSQSSKRKIIKRDKVALLERCRSVANTRGGECLSSVYVNGGTHLEWRCGEGHIWQATPENIVTAGTWCPYCAGNRKGSLERCCAVAKERGGECLATGYTNNRTDMLWRCSEGHEWLACFSHIFDGTWCPYCAGTVKGTLEKCQSTAKDRGGTCLSTEYVNRNTMMLWRCREGHEWNAPASIVLSQGSWCPYCSGRHNGSLERCQSIAKERGGECLSKEYRRSNIPMLWRCSEGHEWSAPTNNIISNGSWCPYCAGQRSGSLERCQAEAESRGGKCLSTEYVNAYRKLRWRCSDGHEWEANADKVLNSGRWCPDCASGVTERICINIAEKLFGHKFTKHRPKWLVNDRGNQMELDGYCEELGVAIEYHGGQHYNFSPRFHCDQDALKQRIKDDDDRRNLCAENGILLIEVPYTIPPEQFPYFIAGFTEKAGSSIEIADPASIEVENCIAAPSKNQEIEQLIAGWGRRIGDYVGSLSPIEIECKRCGTIVKPVISSLRKGHGCRVCANIRAGAAKRKPTHIGNSEVDQAIAGRDLIRLGDYTTHMSKIEIKCNKCSHVFHASPSKLFIGRGCPKCRLAKVWETRRRNQTA